MPWGHSNRPSYRESDNIGVIDSVISQRLGTKRV